MRGQHVRTRGSGRAIAVLAALGIVLPVLIGTPHRRRSQLAHR